MGLCEVRSASAWRCSTCIATTVGSCRSCCSEIWSCKFTFSWLVLHTWFGLPAYLSQHSRAGVNSVAVYQCESEWYNFQAFRQDKDLNTDLASYRSSTGFWVQNIVCNLYSLMSEIHIPWHGSHCLLGSSMVNSWKMLVGLINIFQMWVLSVPHSWGICGLWKRQLSTEH